MESNRLQKSSGMKRNKINYYLRRISRFVIFNTVAFGAYSFFVYIIFRIFSFSNTAKWFADRDIIPYIDIYDYIKFICIVTIVSAFIILFLRLYILIIGLKSYGKILSILIFLSEIMVFLKCRDINYITTYLVSMNILYLLVQFYIVVQTPQILNVLTENRKDLFFTDKAIANENYLTEKQKKALYQLIECIDNRESVESINIALIAEWGKGKTSVTDTLIHKLQTRKDCPRYFILKINTLTLNKTRNLIDYVQKFFYSLFKLYAIVTVGGQEHIEFLSTLSKMLDDSKASNFVKPIFTLNSKSSFIDFEYQRAVFSRQVEILLKKSGRKNILFIMDDADRSEIKEKIKPLLAELSSINGIISIISMSEENRGSYKPQDIIAKAGNSGENKFKIYDELDKYIHLRIRIDDEDRMEYEKSIRDLLAYSYSKLKENSAGGIRYVECNYTNSPFSIFDKINNYTTHLKKPDKQFDDIVERGVLTDIFFENLSSYRETWGEHFEILVMEYLGHCYELSDMISDALKLGPNKISANISAAITLWFGNDIMNEIGIDWLQRLNINAFILLQTAH